MTTVAADGDIEEQVERTRAENPGVRIDSYLLFSSHTDAMALYSVARSVGFDVRVSTTPRDARSSCGVALLVHSDDVRKLCDLASTEAIELEGVAVLPCQIDPHRDTYC